MPSLKLQHEKTQQNEKAWNSLLSFIACILPQVSNSLHVNPTSELFPSPGWRRGWGSGRRPAGASDLREMHWHSSTFAGAGRECWRRDCLECLETDISWLHAASAHRQWLRIEGVVPLRLRCFKVVRLTPEEGEAVRRPRCWALCAAVLRRLFSAGKRSLPDRAVLSWICARTSQLQLHVETRVKAC